MLLALLISHRWSKNHLSFALNVTWLKPTAGDVYDSRTHLDAQWQSDIPAATPSFQLCNGAMSDGSNGDGSTQCGTSVQPSVAQNADGSYQATLYVREYF